MEIIYTAYIKLFWKNIFNYHGSKYPIIFTIFWASLFFGTDVYSQCSGSTQFGTTQIPCSGILRSVSFVPRLQYIKVNVINGINYTFSSSLTGITLVNDATSALVGNTTGTSISYTSTFSGLIRVYNCHAFNVVVTLSFIANNTGSNIQDSQSSCGSNNWLGHMYKRLDNSSFAPPNDADAFTSYVGYINETEIFSEGFGGDFNCLPILSNGSNVISLFTEFFAAKFCNQSVKPKGAYVLSSVTADDGIRFYVAGTLVLDRWINQSATYTNILFQHSGNTKLEIQYYETGGGNVLNVGVMTRVNNVLTTNLNQAICVGSSPTQITGTDVFATAPINSTSGYAVSYQWQGSTDNINFSNIAGATAQNYTPPQTAPGTYYFKRLATVTNTNAGSIPITAVDESNVAQLNIGSTQFGTTQIPCSGLAGSVSSVPRLQYIKVYVINGINYTFTSSLSGITLVNDATSALVGNTAGTSISYTSTFSRIIRVYNCHAFDIAATLSFIANNTGSNIQDSQSSCGSNNWVGHMYKRLDNLPFTPPSNVDAFTSYVGYFNETEIFSEGFGGTTNCFPILSNGSNVINTYSEFFAAKLCNQSVKPKGAYVLSSVTVDDGIRFYVAGTLVFDRWINQGATTYNNILFQHSGNTKLELHYYETDGGNVLNVGVMTRVNNVLTTNLSQTICGGISPGQITGTDVFTTAPINSASGYAVTYQWRIKTNDNYSNIVGATSQNYTPTQIAPGTYYFKRLATVTNTNAGSIPITAVDESNVAQLVINPKPNGIITGEVICAGTATAHLTFTASSGSGPFSLIINGITYNNISSGIAFNITAPLVTTIYNLTKITDINGCMNP